MFGGEKPLKAEVEKGPIFFVGCCYCCCCETGNLDVFVCCVDVRLSCSSSLFRSPVVVLFNFLMLSTFIGLIFDNFDVLIYCEYVFKI